MMWVEYGVATANRLDFIRKMGFLATLTTWGFPYEIKQWKNQGSTTTVHKSNFSQIQKKNP